MTGHDEQTLETYPMVIGGSEVAAISGRTYESVDPFRGQPWAQVPDADAADADRAVVAARDALSREWGPMSARR